MLAVAIQLAGAHVLQVECLRRRLKAVATLFAVLILVNFYVQGNLLVLLGRQVRRESYLSYLQVVDGTRHFQAVQAQLRWQHLVRLIIHVDIRAHLADGTINSDCVILLRVDPIVKVKLIVLVQVGGDK